MAIFRDDSDGKGASVSLPAHGAAVTAQEALQVGLRERVQPLLRTHGYKGSSPTWVRRGEREDVAVVNVQRSSYSTADEVLCVVNVAVAPRPWLDWSEVRLGKRVKAVKESDGLWRDTLHPHDGRVTRGGGEPWWGVRDVETARREQRHDAVVLFDRHQTLRVLDGRFVIAQVADGDGRLHQPSLVALVVGPDGQTAIWRDDASIEASWAALWSGDEAHEPEATGMLNAIIAPLASQEVPVMVTSTFHADLVFVPAGRLDEALAALTAAGHHIVDSPLPHLLESPPELTSRRANPHA